MSRAGVASNAAARAGWSHTDWGQVCCLISDFADHFWLVLTNQPISLTARLAVT